MEAVRQLPAPGNGAIPSTAPILPDAPARPAPRFERREVDLTFVAPPPRRRTSMRGYLYGALALAAISAGGWFGLSEYIYG